MSETLDCRRVAELLPWWLNGTLGADEAARVEDHLETCAVCREELRQTRTAAALHAGHLPVEALVDHEFGVEQSDEVRKLVEEHLETCRHCAAELDLVRSTRAPLARELARDEPAPSGRAAGRRFEIALRAASVIGVLIALAWLSSLFWGAGPGERSTGPSPARLQVLEPLRAGELRSDGGEGTALVLAEGEELVVLELLTGERADLTWTAIARRGESELWRRQGLHIDPGGSVVLVLGRALLPAGRIDIELHAGEEPAKILRYRVSVE